MFAAFFRERIRADKGQVSDDATEPSSVEEDSQLEDELEASHEAGLQRCRGSAETCKANLNLASGAAAIAARRDAGSDTTFQASRILWQ